MNLSNKTTNDKIVRVEVTDRRLSYKTGGDGKPTEGWREVVWYELI